MTKIVESGQSPKVAAALAALPDRGLSSADVERIETLWRASLRQRAGLPMGAAMASSVSTLQEAEAALATVDRLRHPASDQWIAGRIAALLTQFYAADLSEKFQEAIANDWLTELRGYPGWAIQRACRWWVGRDNPDLGKRPLPGHIGKRVAEEMRLPNFLENAARRVRIAPVDAVQNPRPDEASRARIDQLVRESFRRVMPVTSDPQEDASPDVG